jgi:hypothetical protein
MVLSILLLPKSTPKGNFRYHSSNCFNSLSLRRLLIGAILKTHFNIIHFLKRNKAKGRTIQANSENQSELVVKVDNEGR